MFYFFQHVSSSCYKILLISILCFSTSLLAQQAEPIYPLTHSVKSIDYYQQQVELWKNKLDDASSKPIQWLYYYMAAHNANLLATDGREYDLDEIVQQVKETHPDSFERYYLAFATSRQLPEKDRWDLMLRAHQIAPHRTEVWAALILYYELQGDQEAKKKYMQDYLAANLIPNGLLEWNYNALASVDQNGVLLTMGDNDTYPAWVLQGVHGIREDVTIVNIPLLLGYTEYRHRVFRHLGLGDDLDLPLTLPYGEKVSLLINRLQQNLGDRLHFGIGMDARIREQWSQSLYLTGLAFRYSEQALGNLAVLRKNWEKDFRKDALYHPLDYGPSRQTSDQMNLNYLPGLLMLERAYRREEAYHKAEDLRGLSQKIAERAGQEDLLQQFQSTNQASPNFKSNLSLKAIENQMKLIQEDLYASATETTNVTYTAFLLDLIKLRDEDRFNRFSPAAVNWPSLLPEGLASLSGDILYAPYHPDDEEAPIVNISHEAANAFCEWLTSLYNRWDKRKYEKVVFRLPTKEEWTQAARGNLQEHAPYPWGGLYYTNAKGCYLLNTNPFLISAEEVSTDELKEGCRDAPNQDGSFFPTHVTAYHPNSFGLYNVSGNAAEMVQDPSYTMGGSWNEALYYAHVEVKHLQVIPSPMVGFRLFMQILEK